ncbi:MAG: undecaprenyl diphosphate synthase family protein [Planctomycetes bacterium]|nr:undecaprenyl diphosphate synthase family protein [Planctomycetota bacterium]
MSVSHVEVQSVTGGYSRYARLGIGSLTLYAPSRWNWKRPSTEVPFLMRLLRCLLASQNWPR